MGEIRVVESDGGAWGYIKLGRDLALDIKGIDVRILRIPLYEEEILGIEGFGLS